MEKLKLNEIIKEEGHREREFPIMMGYKGFNLENSKLRCRDFIFEVGNTYEIKQKIKLCSQGFHFCNKIRNVYKYYDQDDSIFCNILAFDKIKGDNLKFCCSKIKIESLLNGTIEGHTFKDGKFIYDNPYIASNGDKIWHKNRKRHRDNDEPAIEYINGDKEWYINGKLYSSMVKGNRFWFENGIKIVKW